MSFCILKLLLVSFNILSKKDKINQIEVREMKQIKKKNSHHKTQKILKEEPQNVQH